MMEKTDIDSVQLPMNFNESTRNRFQERLDNAQFFLLLEVPSPNADAELNAVLERTGWYNTVVSDDPALPCALAFTEMNPAKNTLNVCEYASALVPEDRDRHLLYLTGRGRSEEVLSGLMSHARLEGFKNAVCVSGFPAVHEHKRTSGHTESVSALRINASNLPEHRLNCGCAVNPFKYEITSLLLQYFKLIKKINAGASFAAVQAGWDLRKLQELRWHLFKRNSMIPLISRSLFFSMERAEEICQGRDPAIQISNDFRDALRDEMKYSRAQFEAAQWRRLQLMAAGAKLLGYSAIQISGLERRDLAVTAVSMVASAIREFTNLDDWIDAYNEYFARMDMIPYPDDFYLYEPLLRKGTEYTGAVICDEPIPKLSRFEKVRRKAAAFLLKNVDLQPPETRKITKKLLTGCPGCKKCRLDLNGYLCPETCFCGLANGVCGEISANGICPYTGKNCPHVKTLSQALEKKDFRILEDRFI